MKDTKAHGKNARSAEHFGKKLMGNFRREEEMNLNIK
jgi:hypothetical protein